MAKKDDSRDWKAAGEKCLTAALKKAQEFLDDGQIEKLKACETLIKTVSEVVGFGASVGRGTSRSQANSSEEDD